MYIRLFTNKDFQFLCKATGHRNDIAHGYFMPDNTYKYGENFWSYYRRNIHLSIDKHESVHGKLMETIEKIINELDMKNVDGVGRKIGAIFDDVQKPNP